MRIGNIVGVKGDKQNQYVFILGTIIHVYENNYSEDMYDVLTGETILSFVEDKYLLFYANTMREYIDQCLLAREIANEIKQESQTDEINS